MTIINGVESGGRVETLLDLEDLWELTSEGFRTMWPGTLEIVAGRLKAEDARAQGGAEGGVHGSDSLPGRALDLSESDDRFLHSLAIRPPGNDQESPS